MNWMQEFDKRGGIASTRQLRDAGATERALGRVVADGRLIRPRNGRYAKPGVFEAAIAAVRMGGRLSCVSAARSYGLWGGMDARTHATVPPTAGRAGVEAGAVLHWRACRAHPEIWRVSVADCLRSVVACADEETSVAVLDTALSAGLVSIRDIERTFASEPQRARTIARRARPGSDSGVESILRQRLTARGHLVEQQIAVPGAGRVDARVDGILYVEVDGFAFHSGREAFERDRMRDAALALRGDRWLRVSARNLLSTPDSVVATIEAVLEREESGRARRG
ncbi:DNA topoisomerase I [Leifsonia xyli subsp. cynodontis DSM 46306]|uniref:DUF559 domain-containing protein n=1 Tax=Leifsonia xyli subsp. cynodontis DSM 46306 TaxID=1389489 RepID=U3P4I4_LEIXC|nr:type IV toxin-antitoxin system AbiEi family antitoxin domain-containing protein [Leifsonia xyli]AGW40676.1 DNA topoisomerase I [Leifsonia xyli subsp. cynodontis DSM 46306]